MLVADMGAHGKLHSIRIEFLGRGGSANPTKPYMPVWGAVISKTQVSDLIAYLRSLPPVRRVNQPHQGELPLARWAYRAWRLLFVRSGTPPAPWSSTTQVEGSPRCSRRPFEP